jgi:pSer/pThr/pTyr-binding forkhead associated (FHA) protein
MHHDLELAEGEFAIGRSAACQLSLDDPLVSRRHAIFKVAAGEILLEDLGSRNGVLVNGQRISGQVKVRPGDKVLIGSQEVTVIQLDELNRASAPGARRTLSVHRSDIEAAIDEQSVVTKITQPTSALNDELSFVRRLDGFRVLGSVAEKALAMGRSEEAERVLATSLSEVLEAARKGRAIPAPLAEQATRFAAKLATATGKGSWIDYVIEVYSTQQRPAPAVVVDELYGAFRKVSAVDVARVKAYVETLRERLSSFGPADRFLFQRIEGLERLATLRS